MKVSNQFLLFIGVLTTMTVSAGRGAARGGGGGGIKSIPTSMERQEGEIIVDSESWKGHDETLKASISIDNMENHNIMESRFMDVSSGWLGSSSLRHDGRGGGGGHNGDEEVSNDDSHKLMNYANDRELQNGKGGYYDNDYYSDDEESSNGKGGYYDNDYYSDDEESSDYSCPDIFPASPGGVEGIGEATTIGDWKDSKTNYCCDGGASYLKTVFHFSDTNGDDATTNVWMGPGDGTGTYSPNKSGQLTLDADMAWSVSSCPDTEGKGSSYSKSSSKKNRMSDGSGSSGRRLGRHRGGTRDRRRGRAERRKLTGKHSGDGSSSEMRYVRFISCDDVCLTDLFNDSIECSSLSTTIDVEPTAQVCLVMIDPVNGNTLDLSAKMPTNLPVWFIEDEGEDGTNEEGGAAVLRTILHTSCSKPLIPPYGSLFDNPCGHASGSDLVNTNLYFGSYPFLAFIDGISTDYFEYDYSDVADMIDFDITFQKCGCDDTGDPASSGTSASPTSSPSTTSSSTPTTQSSSPSSGPTEASSTSPTTSPSSIPSAVISQSPTVVSPVASPLYSPVYNSPFESPAYSPFAFNAGPPPPDTDSPSNFPSTVAPDCSPTASPDNNQPTVSPSLHPSSSPSNTPSEVQRTQTPSISNSASPTSFPSVAPTEGSGPSTQPSSSPSVLSSFSPSGVASIPPTEGTDLTDSPSGSPSVSTPSPTTDAPSESPSVSTSSPNTDAPSGSPSDSTSSPTTDSPSESPSDSTSSPTTDSPSGSPSDSTSSPTTDSPSESPSDSTSAPTTAGPSNSPTVGESRHPSSNPSPNPSATLTDAAVITNEPSSALTSSPTEGLSASPSWSPTQTPSFDGGEGSPFPPDDCPPADPTGLACVDFINSSCEFVDGVFDIDNSSFLSGSCTFTTSTMAILSEAPGGSDFSEEDGDIRRRLAEIDYYYQRIQHLSTILESLKRDEEKNE